MGVYLYYKKERIEMKKRKLKNKTALKFTPDELRGYYETVKNSARVSRNKKKYYRSVDKKVLDT